MFKSSAVAPLAVLGALCAVLAVTGCRSSQVNGPAGQSITAVTARSMQIRRGEQQPLEVEVDRENVTVAVTVSIWQLPRGVSSDKSSVKSETTAATFILTATRDAPLVENQAVGVTIEGMNGRRASHYVNLTVTD